jgi:hypothetical protein
MKILIFMVNSVNFYLSAYGVSPWAIAFQTFGLIFCQWVLLKKGNLMPGDLLPE